MLILQNVTYTHSNRDLLFADLNLTINKHDKVALIGNNGAGKSTLLKMLAGELFPSQGTVKTSSRPFYVPQIFGQFNELTVAQALGIEVKLNALKEILDGRVTDDNLALLDDDWAIEERCEEALAHWMLDGLYLTQTMETLSGGQKTKVFLAGIMIHSPEIVLLDEPTNHLDAARRLVLYDYIRYTANTLVVVSHDRTLLNALSTIYELARNGITVYGGNYDFYREQKKIETEALSQELKSSEKVLRKARETERESLERQQKLDARGKKKQEKSGLPTISMNTFKNNAEKSTARIKGVHAEKVDGILKEVDDLRKAMPEISGMKMDFDNSALHKGKILITAKGVNFGYGERMLWKQSLDFQITSGQRIVIRGSNGSGKTTLIKLMQGEVGPGAGSIDRADVRSVYIDQEYSLINNALNVYEQAQMSDSGALQEHEIKIRLNRFLFTKAYWDKPCVALSGGEKMRLILCCLMISSQSPDVIILDEPTNNLDIQNIEIVTSAINEYQGTLLVVSHDDYFLEQINVVDSINIS